MVKNWLKIWIYYSKKNKAYFLLTIFCLTIGITAVLLSSLYWKEETSFDQWNENKNDIYFLESRNERAASGYQPYILSRLLKENYDFVEDYLLYSGYFSSDVDYKEKEYSIEKILQTNGSFFAFFPYKICYGSPSSIFKNPKEIALEKEKASHIFGEGINPIGEQLVVDEEVYTVVAVYDLEGKRSSFMPDAVVNVHQFVPLDLVDNWNYSSSSVLIKTQEGERLNQATEDIYIQYYLSALAKERGVPLEEFEKLTNGIYSQKIITHTLEHMHFGAPEVIITPELHAERTTLYVIVGLSWVLLVLSLFNYVNLALSQTLARAKEVGIRKVLGGSRKKLFVQTLLETAITMLISLLVSLLLTLCFLPVFNSFLEVNIRVNPLEIVSLGLGVFLFLLCLGGVIPALYRANYQVLKVLKGNYHRTRSGSLLQNAILVVQFAIACWFISGTYIIYKQLSYMKAKELGFKGDQVIVFPFQEEIDEDEERNRAYQVFKQEALKIKGVEQLAFSDLDYSEKERSPFVRLFIYEGQNISAAVYNVEEGYLEMMQIGLKEGRYLSNQLANDSIQNALINESLFQQLNKETIEDLVLGGIAIVGVVHDFHTAGLTYSISPKMFVLPSEKHFNLRSVSLKLDVHQLDTTIPALEKLWLTFHKGTSKPFEYNFMNQKFAQSFEKTQQQQQIMVYLSYLVVFLALFGLFSVSSYTIGTKLREISIRKVLGANTQALIQKLSFQYLIYCIIGFGLSIFPSYYLLNQWLSGYAYRIEIGFEVYVSCFFLMTMLTLSIVVSRAYQATRVNVLTYIKYE